MQSGESTDTYLFSYRGFATPLWQFYPAYRESRVKEGYGIRVKAP